MVTSPVEDTANTRESPGGRDGGMRWQRRIPPLSLLGLGLSAAWGSWDLKLGTLHYPAPGLWPFVISCAIIISAGALMIWPGNERTEPWSTKSLSVTAGIASLGGFIVLFDLIGFFIPAVLMILLWLRVFSRESWRWTVVFATTGPAVLYVLFDQLLGVPFPADLAIGAF